MVSRIVRPAKTRDEGWSIIAGNIGHATEMIRKAAGEGAQLVVLPEFALQGPPRGETVDDWIDKACYSVPGRITEPLQTLAQELRLFIAGNQFEADPEWPHRHFNTSFLIDPSGEVILRYRRVHTAQWVSPHDFLDAYIERYGWDGLYPVVDTPLGRLAMLACGEILVPESSRVLMLRGAEVILHPTNEPISPGEEAAKVTAAAANMVFVISANVAGPIGFSDGEPMNSASGTAVTGGNSRIVDFDGNDLAFAPHAKETLDVTATIDVKALRAARRDLTMRNQILRTRFEAVRHYYEGVQFYPANSFLGRPMTHWRDTAAVAEASMENLVQRGIALPAEVPALE
jgi:predicted amidohydrolase